MPFDVVYASPTRVPGQTGTLPSSDIAVTSSKKLRPCTRPYQDELPGRLVHKHLQQASSLPRRSTVPSNAQSPITRGRVVSCYGLVTTCSGSWSPRRILPNGSCFIGIRNRVMYWPAREGKTTRKDYAGLRSIYSWNSEDRVTPDAKAMQEHISTILVIHHTHDRATLSRATRPVSPAYPGFPRASFLPLQPGPLRAGAFHLTLVEAKRDRDGRGLWDKAARQLDFRGRGSSRTSWKGFTSGAAAAAATAGGGY